MTDIREIYRSGDKLGEVPVWDVAEQALYWVDIENLPPAAARPRTGRVDDWTFPSASARFALRQNGGLVCALASGFAFFEPATGESSWIAKPEAHIARNRFNDGKCDRAGPVLGRDDGRSLARAHRSALSARPGSDGHPGGDGIGISNSPRLEPGRDDLLFRRHDGPCHLRL